MRNGGQADPGSGQGGSNNVWRAFAFLAASVAILFAVRDAFGFTDAYAVTDAHYELHDHVWGFVRLLMIAVGATVAWRGVEQPQGRILAGGLIGLSLNNNWWFYAADDPLLWPSGILNYLGVAFGLTQLIRFAASYGTGDWRAVRSTAGRVAPYLGGAIALSGLMWWFSAVVFASPQPVLNTLFWLGWDAANVLIIAASVVAMLTSAPADRSTVVWILGSFSVAALGTAIHSIDRLLEGDTLWANDLDTIAQIALPIGLGYAVLRHHALGVDFVVTRAALFGLLTLVVGACFSVAEGQFSGWVASIHLVRHGSQLPAHVVELGLSIGTAASYKALGGLVDRAMDALRGRVVPDAPDPTDATGSESQRVAALERRLAELEAAQSSRATADPENSDTKG